MVGAVGDVTLRDLIVGTYPIARIPLALVQHIDQNQATL
jgi:hypothetical protein